MNMTSVINIGYFIITLLGVIFMLIAKCFPKYLPDKLIFPDKNKYIVKDFLQYRKIKENQLFTLGIYAVLIGVLNPTNLITSFTNKILVISMFFVVIIRVEKKLKNICILKSDCLK